MQQRERNSRNMPHSGLTIRRLYRASVRHAGSTVQDLAAEALRIAEVALEARDQDIGGAGFIDVNAVQPRAALGKPAGDDLALPGGPSTRPPSLEVERADPPLETRLEVGAELLLGLPDEGIVAQQIERDALGFGIGDEQDQVARGAVAAQSHVNLRLQVDGRLEVPDQIELEQERAELTAGLKVFERVNLLADARHLRLRERTRAKIGTDARPPVARLP